jgi:hypothetical protein
MGSRVSGFKYGGLVIGVILFLVFMLFIGFTSGSTNIGFGEVGVRFDRLGGGVSEHQYNEGITYKSSLVSIRNSNTKTQVFTMSGTNGIGGRSNSCRLGADHNK